MSTTAITLGADMWEGDDEGVVTTWLYADGAAVKEGDVVAEVMVEKVEMEVQAPASGTLRIASKAEDIVSKGTSIGHIE